MATMTMTRAVDELEIGRWLAAARGTIANVQHCWLATQSLEGGANARAVRINPAAPGSDEWTRRFICRRDSRKVCEIRLQPRVTLAYQTETCDAYVALGGTARLLENRAEMRSMWPDSADSFFPDGFADADMIAVRVDVDRIELHVRGVTREPFGHGRSAVERTEDGAWRFVPA